MTAIGSQADSGRLDLEAPETQRAERVLTLVLWIWAATLTVVIVRSMWWPRAHDLSLMEFVAWSIRNGAVPYADVVDMNMPGIYALHIGEQSLLGVGDLQTRIVDLALFAGASCALWRLLLPFCRKTKVSAGLLFGTFHFVVFGVNDALQRDWIVAIGLIVTLMLLFETSHRRVFASVAGLVGGYMLTIKPQAAILIIVIIGLLFRLDEFGINQRVSTNEGPVDYRARARLVGFYLAGIVTSVTIVVGWLLWVGAFDSLVDLATGYLPLYARLDGAGHSTGSLAAALARAVLRSPVLWHLLFPVIGLFALLTGRDAPGRARVVALAWATVAGYAFLIVSTKVWWYQSWPALLPGIALTGVVVGDLMRETLTPVARPKLRTVLRWAPSAVAVLLLLMTVAAAGTTSGFAAYDRSMEIAAELRSRAEPGDTAQAFDTTGGAIDALLRAEVPLATPFLYDFYFFHDVDDPEIQGLRREFIEHFDAARPRFLVVMKRSWGVRDDYGDLDSFPKLASRIARDYRIVWESPDARLYQRNATPS